VREPLLTPTFVVLAIAHFAHALSFYLYLHLPAFLTELGGSELFVGVLYGAMSATAILARPFLGRVMDQRGRRPIMLSGGALGAVACAGYLLVGSLGPWIWIVRISHGLAEAMLFASLFALATDIVGAITIAAAATTVVLFVVETSGGDEGAEAGTARLRLGPGAVYFDGRF